MKTIREHLESIADTELREAALRNAEAYIGRRIDSDKTKHKYEALMQSFEWNETPEGFEFWHNVANCIYHGNTPTYQQFKHLIK
jgi:hypothetical protein